MAVNLKPTTPSDAVRKQIFILEDLSSSVFSPFKKYHPSGNLKLKILGIFQSLKLPISVEKNPSNFSPPKFYLQVLQTVIG